VLVSTLSWVLQESALASVQELGQLPVKMTISRRQMPKSCSQRQVVRNRKLRNTSTMYCRGTGSTPPQLNRILQNTTRQSFFFDPKSAIVNTLDHPDVHLQQ
jgi:hypothetical protein